MKYSAGDIATYYFIINETDDLKIIKAWTDNKDLAQFYIDFHRCGTFKLKKRTDIIDNIAKILEENYHDEIVLFNAIIKNKEKRGKGKIITIPVTKLEVRYINEECQSFLFTTIEYSYLNEVIPFIKKKYQKAFDDIFLTSVIKKVIEEKTDKYIQSLELDQLAILMKSFPETFGK